MAAAPFIGLEDIYWPLCFKGVPVESFFVMLVIVVEGLTVYHKWLELRAPNYVIG